MKRLGLSILLAVIAWPSAPALGQENGERLFKQRCGICHQLDTTRNGMGPHLQKFQGRTAGAVQGYNYSPALKSSGIVWSRETLDTFLTNPTAMVRGTKMAQRFANSEERAAIIEFLLTR
ncbi:c-type cytochrome [Mesorhizobium sp. NPDC059054]|uniref:c-type cytochrome n=1 Tax=Mesorhizobium sp. NPDC059054 TaxID=3346711 RepID=UPI00369E3883